MHKQTLRQIGLMIVGIFILALAWGVQVSAQEQDDPQYQLGAQVYAENCALCHGPNGEGRVGATLAKDWPSIRPDLITRETISRGVEGSAMPAWSQENGGPLADEELDALVFFILSWQIGGAPQITPGNTPTPRAAVSPVPGIEGDPNQGGELYDQNCAVCHGIDGEGRIGATLAKDWPSIRPDLSVKSTIEKGVPGSVMPAWSQANGGPLSENDVHDLVAFVMTWSGAPLESETGVNQNVDTTGDEASSLSGWTGFLVTIVVFGLIIALFLLIQYYAQRNGRNS
jgi:cytochrome c oxidase cbb3-type subunit III